MITQDFKRCENCKHWRKKGFWGWLLRPAPREGLGRCADGRMVKDGLIGWNCSCDHFDKAFGVKD